MRKERTMSLPIYCGAITLQYTKKCVYHTVVKGTPVLTKSGGHATSQIHTSHFSAQFNSIGSASFIVKEESVLSLLISLDELLNRVTYK